MSELRRNIEIYVTYYKPNYMTQEAKQWELT
jgi:hypothetical protein